MSNDYQTWYACLQMAYAAEFIQPQNRKPVLPASAVEEAYFQGSHDARCWIGRWNGNRVLMFQGTQVTEPESILANLNTSPIPLNDNIEVVAGYWDQLQDLMAFLAQGSQEFQIVGGHSMGGAIATQYVRQRVAAYTGPTQLITFGAPKSGNTAFYNSPLLLNSLRIVNGPDPAPDWPLAWDANPIPMQWLNNNTCMQLVPKFPLGPVERPIFVDPFDLSPHFPGSYLGALEGLL